VVAAVHVASGTRVAIKYLSPQLFGDPGFLAAFRGEAQLLRSLADPHIVRLLDYVEAPGRGAAIVMELVSGVSLHEMVTQQGPTGPESALVVLKGSLLGLAAAHARGIVHRDYKPENVLVDAQGDSKLTDFGVATRRGQHAPAGGTPLYMAPEQWDGTPATPAADIYAATVVFFECLTGMTPFSGGLAQLAAQHAAAAVPVELIDEPLRDLISCGMAKDPAARPASATTLLTQLETTAAAAYGSEWESRGLAQLAGRAAALLLLLLHGSATAAAASGTGSSTVTTTLAPKAGVLSHIGLPTAIIGAGVAVAVAAAVIVARPTGHTPPPAAQWTGTQLAAALLPLSDFPAGYQEGPSDNSGTSLYAFPYTNPLNNVSCGVEQTLSVFSPTLGFSPEVDWGVTASASYEVALNVAPTSGEGVLIYPKYLSEAIYQFATPAEAVAFLAALRTCLTSQGPSISGVETTSVNGDQAVTAFLQTPTYASGFFTIGNPLFVLHGTDVLALSASALVQSQSQVAIPQAAQRIAELSARIDALGHAPTVSRSQ
jgi:serine/threonine-protein kinase